MSPDSVQILCTCTVDLKPAVWCVWCVACGAGSFLRVITGTAEQEVLIAELKKYLRAHERDGTLGNKVGVGH